MPQPIKIIAEYGVVAATGGLIGSSFTQNNETTSSNPPTFVALTTPDSVTFSLSATRTVVIKFQATTFSLNNPSCATIVNIDGSNVTGGSPSENYVAIPFGGDNMAAVNQFAVSLASGSHTVAIKYAATANTCGWYNRLLTVE